MPESIAFPTSSRTTTTPTTNRTYTFFDKYFDYVKDTESPLLFHRWCAISSIAALLGRKVWMPYFPADIYPNMYIQLVGDPGVRKSSAINIARALAKESDYTAFAYSSTSGAKFLQDLYEGFGPPSKSDDLFQSVIDREIYDESSIIDAPASECWVCSAEFNNFLGHGNIDFISALTDLWDMPTTTDVRLKTGPSFQIIKPTVNIIGGNTQQGIEQSMPAAVIGQGFLSRMIFVFGAAPEHKITFPTRPSPAQLEELGALGRRIRQLEGPMELTPEAKKLCDFIYNNERKIEDARFQHYMSRRLTHLFKLMIVVAASRLSMTIDAMDVLYANTILTFTELDMPKALGEFGFSKNSQVTNKVMEVLLKSKEPMTATELHRHVIQDVERLGQLGDILHHLAQGGKIKSTTRFNAKKQIDENVYYAVRKSESVFQAAHNDEDVTVNYNLLYEVQHAKRKVHGNSHQPNQRIA